MGVSHFQCWGQWNFQMREITTEIWVQEQEKSQEVGNWTLSEFLTSLIMNTAKAFSFYSKFRVICSVTITKSHTATAVAAKSLQSCPTLCDPIDGNPPGSPVPGSLQARTLEWVAISFSNAWKWKVKVKSLSRVRLFETPWTAAYQAPLPMVFSRQEYWSGVPLPSLVDRLPLWKEFTKCWMKIVYKTL